MEVLRKHILFFVLACCALIACNDDNESVIDSCLDEGFFSTVTDRSFKMGFTTWPYAPDPSSVFDTFDFIEANGDIYTEHYDTHIPWYSYINNSPLPSDFTETISFKTSQKPQNLDMVLAVSLLNTLRTGLMEDADGNVPAYSSLNDDVIFNAYMDHLRYLVNAFQPEYLLFGIEVDFIFINDTLNWNEYLALSGRIQNQLRIEYPLIQISASITLHNLVENSDVSNMPELRQAMASYMSGLDFSAISFYPFTRQFFTKTELRTAFDLLHSLTQNRIAFVETNSIAEDLNIPNLGINILGNECIQNTYLEFGKHSLIM